MTCTVHQQIKFHLACFLHLCVILIHLAQHSNQYSMDSIIDIDEPPMFHREERIGKKKEYCIPTKIFCSLWLVLATWHLQFLLIVLPQLSSAFFRLFCGFFVTENAVINVTVQEMVPNIAPPYTFQIKKKLSKYMQPILKYSKNSMWFFWMAPQAAQQLNGLCDQPVAQSFWPNR